MGLKDFKRLKKLGAGSYGSVFKVRREKDGEIYALKEVNLRALSAREREDAVNEIRLLASMHHHNVVRYCEAFVEKDNLYIVLEFAKHGDLAGLIKKQQEKRTYLALQYLHKHKVLHRDLKPGNIFVGEDGRLKLGDFGCSKLLNRVRMARTQVGTPYYMSPELWNSQRYDEKSDVWALGCILFELAALKPPFRARSIAALAVKVETAKTPLIPETFSPELRKLARALLNKDPSRRPSLDRIMNSTVVSRFSNKNVRRLSAPPNATPTKMELIRTIRVPKGSAKAMRKISFPKSHYPKGRPQSSPARPVMRKNASMMNKILPRIRSGEYLPHIGGGNAARRLSAGEDIVAPVVRTPRRNLFGGAVEKEVAANEYASYAKPKRPLRRAILWNRPDANGNIATAGNGGGNNKVVHKRRTIKKKKKKKSSDYSALASIYGTKVPRRPSGISRGYAARKVRQARPFRF